MSGSVPLLFKSLAGELSLDLSTVSARLYDSQNKILYLGTETGEIFSLQISTKQDSIGCTIRSFLTCSLESQSSTNRVMVMTLGEIPFHQLTDSSPVGLISIHADGRIRLWDPKDARCLLCSSAGTIESPENLLSLEATSNSTRRFVFAIDSTGQCTFIDLWGLKVHKIKESAKIPAVGSLAEEQTIFVIDQDEKIRVYELVGLQSKMLLEYENFLANPDEMDLVIAGHRTLPAQNAFLPVRQSQILATENSLSIATFSDPPTDFMLGQDLIAVVYRSKLVVYMRQEVLLLGKLLPFETVRATANEFKTVVWEWEGLDKPLVKGCWLRDGSILLVTDQLQTVVVSSNDLNQLLSCDHTKSLNIYTPMLKATKMRDSSVVSVIQKVTPKSLLGPGEKLPAAVTSKQMFTDSQDELLCVMLGSANRLQIYRIESPPGGLAPVFLLDEESGSLSPSKPSQMSLCEPVLAAKFGFGKRNPPNVADCLMRAMSSSANKLLTEEGLSRLLEQALTGSETVTASCMAVLKDGDVCMLLGTSQGGILIIPTFIVPHGELDMFWIQAEGSVQSIEVQNYMVLASCANELVTVKFKKDDAGHRELARIQSKKEKSVVLREVASSQITRLHVSSHIERILSMIVLNQGETWPGSTPDPIVTQFCNNTVGVCLQGGQLALLDLVKAEVIFEHRCSQATPVGIFFDKRGEYLLMLFADGQIDVFSVAVGNISMISGLNSKIKDSLNTQESTRLAFEIKLLLADSFSYERTIWIEEMGLVGLGGRKLLEDYRETYAELKAFSSFSSNQLVNVTQAGIVFQFATQAYTDELTLTHINYAALRTQNRSLRPTPLELERLKASLEKIKQMEDVGFNGMTSLKDLEGYFGNGTESGAKPPPLNLEQLPQKFQNLLERNWFALARERLGDLPVKLLERIENDEQRLGNGNQGLTSEDRLQLVRILVSLHYSHRKAFSDPSDDSNLPVLKKRYAGQRLWILCYQPPIFDPNSSSRQNKLATIFLPQGIDLQSELELKAALGEPTPVFEYALGNQGLAESFGFLLPEGFVPVDSLMKSSSPPLRRAIRAANPLAISKSMTTTILLSIVSELIFVLKKCYPKVPSLVASIRALFFERQDVGTTSFVAPSHLQLILSTLNDKLLLSASAHFALNNILDPKNVSGSSLADPTLLKSLNYCWDSIKKNKNYLETEPLSVLDGVSKFELFIISCILFQSKISSGGVAVGAPREEIVAKLAPVLE